MRILVTGGAGFIGSHLCERLLAEGHDVICLDNFFTGSKDNIIHLLDSHRFELDPPRHHRADPAGGRPDLQPGLSRPHRSTTSTTRSRPIKTSVMGAINMLGLAKRVKARILQASTSEVYGDPQVHPQTEDYWGNVNPIGIRSCYDEGKRVAETLMMDYHRQNSVDIRIIRIFNTYGPRMAENDGRVVSNFMLQALRGEDITVYGDGSQTRSFCYVDDLVEGMIRMMECDGFIGPVNLGNPVENTILEFAEKIIAITGSTSRIINNPLPQDDPKQRQPRHLSGTRKTWLEAAGGIGDRSPQNGRIFCRTAQKRVTRETSLSKEDIPDPGGMHRLHPVLHRLR